MSSRFAVSIHIMSVVAFRDGAPVPSSVVADSVNTSAGVVRQITMRLNDAGLLDSRRGKRGGSLLSRDPHEISLLEIYEAVEDVGLVQKSPNTPAEFCVIGRNISPVISSAIAEAEAAFLERLSAISLADVLLETLASESTRVNSYAGWQRLAGA